MRTAILLVVGAACIGTGILTLATGGLGITDSAGNLLDLEVAEAISKLGYDGVADLVFTSSSTMAIALCVVGAAMMIGANAVAWKETGGY